MKNKIFYGWYMLAAMTLMYAASNGIALYAFGVLRKMQAEQAPFFGLDAATQSALPALLFISVALVSPIVGSLLDRYSPKMIIGIGAVLVVILTFSQQFMTSYNGLRAIYAFFAVAVSFVGIIPFMFLINRWFKKHIGMAAGILLLGSSIGGIVFPKIVAAAGNWQVACNWLGFAAVAFMLLPYLLIKNDPSEIGETADGEALKTAENAVYTEGSLKIMDDGLIASKSTTYAIENGVTLSQALRSTSFYLVILVTGVMWFCINGYIQNHAFFMSDLGKDATQAAAIFGTFSMTAIFGKLLFGWLSDKTERRQMMAASIGLMLLSIVLVKFCASNPALVMPFAVIFGLGFGGAFTMIQIWVADIYAGKNFGSILGVVTMADTIAGSAGMITLGNLRKSAGTYDGGFNIMLALCAVALVATFFVKKRTT
jgi:MFS transporter, OFA family, oxalate/formate antiporter